MTDRLAEIKKRSEFKRVRGNVKATWYSSHLQKHLRKDMAWLIAEIEKMRADAAVDAARKAT